jgi:hypothetical protein
MDANYAYNCITISPLPYPYNESCLNRCSHVVIIHHYAVVMAKWGELYFDQLKWKHLKGFLASRWAIVLSSFYVVS